jgi:hypothetical protein
MTSSDLSFAGFTWEASKGCRACTHVLDGQPVHLFVHEPDGSLQFLCGAEGHADDDACWVHAAHVLRLNPDLRDLPTVDFGEEAERSEAGAAWVVTKTPLES